MRLEYIEMAPFLMMCLIFNNSLVIFYKEKKRIQQNSYCTNMAKVKGKFSPKFCHLVLDKEKSENGKRLENWFWNQ